MILKGGGKAEAHEEREKAEDGVRIFCHRAELEFGREGTDRRSRNGVREGRAKVWMRVERRNESGSALPL
jgi:hypothetical protein